MPDTTSGRLLVCDLPTDVTVEWLEVRRDADAGILLVPTDDGPFCGACDVRLEVADFQGIRQAYRFARCGVSVWVTPEDLGRCGPIEVGAVSADELKEVRQVLADLARGRPMPDASADNDPEYWHLTAELERLGLLLTGGRV